MEDDIQNCCAHCSFVKAQNCEAGQLVNTARFGTHSIYMCETGGLYFCLNTANEVCGDAYVEEIACVEFSW